MKSDIRVNGEYGDGEKNIAGRERAYGDKKRACRDELQVTQHYGFDAYHYRGSCSDFSII